MSRSFLWQTALDRGAFLQGQPAPPSPPLDEDAPALEPSHALFPWKGPALLKPEEASKVPLVWDESTLPPEIQNTRPFEVEGVALSLAFFSPEDVPRLQQERAELLCLLALAAGEAAHSLVRVLLRREESLREREERTKVWEAALF